MYFGKCVNSLFKVNLTTKKKTPRTGDLFTFNGKFYLLRVLKTFIPTNQ